MKDIVTRISVVCFLFGIVAINGCNDGAQSELTSEPKANNEDLEKLFANSTPLGDTQVPDLKSLDCKIFKYGKNIDGSWPLYPSPYKPSQQNGSVRFERRGENVFLTIKKPSFSNNPWATANNQGEENGQSSVKQYVASGWGKLQRVKHNTSICLDIIVQKVRELGYERECWEIRTNNDLRFAFSVDKSLETGKYGRVLARDIGYIEKLPSGDSIPLGANGSIAECKATW